MDIFRRLKILYSVRLKGNLNETRTFNLIIDGEEILMKNPNFWNLNWREQLPIINFFIKKDRIRYKTKNFFNQKWDELEE